MTTRPNRTSFVHLMELMRDRVLDSAEGPGAGGTEGLRERKKRLTRQLISDTATAMFLERGFHKVRVAEVAEATGVSEKTVYNYFPTKESLVLDREQAIARQIRFALSQGAPVPAAVEVITADVRTLFANFRDAEKWATMADSFRMFMEMVDETPELRTAQQDMNDRMVQLAAEVLADRVGVDPAEPEPQIAASAIVALWRIQYQSIQRHVVALTNPTRAANAVIADVRRAGRLIESGLWCFEAIVQDSVEREELRAAAQSAEDAVRQVVAAVRQARAVWKRRSR